MKNRVRREKREKFYSWKWAVGEEGGRKANVVGYVKEDVL